MSPKQTLTEARNEKRDEFYTQIGIIEKELKHYKESGQFKNKVVLCNCDDPEYSNFWFYFKEQFEEFGLKKLIITHYAPTTFIEKGDAYKLEYTGGKKPRKKKLKGDGDFLSDECIKLLEEADIVVTNPPFSLFKEYVAQLMEYKKKFLIIGNVNAVFYKEFSPLFIDNKMWMGCTLKNTAAYFRVPDDYPFKNKRSYIEDGCRFIRVKDVRWFTNLKHERRNDTIPLYKRYTKAEYPKYDNYDAIEVGKVNEIPKEYYKPMGVPITYLDKHNPNQFEIIAFSAGLGLKSPDGKNTDGFYLNGKKKFARILIRRRDRK